MSTDQKQRENKIVMERWMEVREEKEEKDDGEVGIGVFQVSLSDFSSTGLSPQSILKDVYKETVALLMVFEVLTILKW